MGIRLLQSLETKGMGKKIQKNKRRTNTQIPKRNKRKKPETRTKNTRTTKNNSRKKY